MTARISPKAVARQLFAIPGTTVHAILDGASVPRLPQTLEQMGVESECLLRGELDPEVAVVAPYLAVVPPPDHPFTEWLLGEGWGRHWGVFAISKADLRDLRMHLRTFLQVYGPDLKPLYFRYYDPRVLRTYLPTCNELELRTMFGPVLRYVVEDEKPVALLKFWHEGDECRKERVILTLSSPVQNVRG